MSDSETLVQRQLLCAVKDGDLEKVKHLIKNGGEVNYEYKYDDGRSNCLLHNASYFGKFEVAKLLIKHGAQIDSRDFEGKTPLAIAARKARLEASQGHLEFVKLLLENGADVNSKDNYKSDPSLYLCS